MQISGEEVAPSKAKTRLSAGNVLAIVFFNYPDILPVMKLLRDFGSNEDCISGQEWWPNHLTCYSHSFSDITARAVSKLNENHWNALSPFLLRPCDFHLG